MPSYNKTIIAGHLTRDPETRQAGSSSVCSFSIAVGRKFKGKDGQMQEETSFIDVEAWGKTGELVAQYLSKGSACLVDGRLKQDTWEQDGNKRSKIKVVAESVQFLGGKGEPKQDKPAPSYSSSYEDESPF